MDLRPRLRQSFSGFTRAEIQKLEQSLSDFKEQTLENEFSKKLARLFNRSSGRAGKPVVKWTEIQSWFQKNQQQGRDASLDKTKKLHAVSETLTEYKVTGNPKAPEDDIVVVAGEDSVEFEARSSKDGAWYDVDTFLSHRFASSGEPEILVRFVGLGEEEDEWVDVRNSVRVRSVALDNSECQKLKVGDLVVCFQVYFVLYIGCLHSIGVLFFRNSGNISEPVGIQIRCPWQEKQDQGRYYDAHVLEIQRRWHDIRGCRCLFLIRFDHDNMEERVRLRRLCHRPTSAGKLKEK